MEALPAASLRWTLNSKYKDPSVHTEYVEYYKEGGFHPVYLNDLLHNRYLVFRKLGFGARSTVWLAKDLLANRYVAVKVIMADYSEDLGIEATFKPSFTNHKGRACVQEKLDAFTVDGPNGRHACFVFEPLGRDLEALIDVAQGFISIDDEDRKFFPKTWSATFARDICQRILLGLDFLHSERIMHRDLYTGNMLIALQRDIDSMKAGALQGDVWKKVEGLEIANPNLDIYESTWAKVNYQATKRYINIIECLDGQPLRQGDIKYTVGAIPLHDRLVFDGDLPITPFRVILTDLGSACKFEDCNRGPNPYRLDLCSPQILLGLPYDEKADIWSLGVTLARIVLLDPPIFNHVNRNWPTKQEMFNQQLASIIRRLGPIPEDLRSRWPDADRFVNSAGELLNPGEYDLESEFDGGIDQAVRLAKPKDMPEPESDLFERFIRSMLQYDPSKRPSTAELLDHPWITTLCWE